MDKTKLYVISNKDSFIMQCEEFGKGDLGRSVMNDMFVLTDWYFELCGITSVRTGDHFVVFASMIQKTNVDAPK